MTTDQIFGNINMFSKQEVRMNRKRRKSARRRAMRHRHFVTIFHVWQAFGGREEGGWWFLAGEPISNHRLNREFKTRQAASNYERRADAELAVTDNKGLRPLSSVLSTGRYEARVSSGRLPEPFPSRTPHYE